MRFISIVIHVLTNSAHDTCSYLSFFELFYSELRLNYYSDKSLGKQSDQIVKKDFEQVVYKK